MAKSKSLNILGISLVIPYLIIMTFTGCSNSGSDAYPAGPGYTERPTWSGKVGPLFQQRCVACHSTAPRSGGLNLSSYGGLMEGGDSGPVIVPGQPGSSLLVKRIDGTSGERMPRGGPYLSDGDITMVREWIANGARND